MAFPLNQWYLGAFSWEIEDRPLGRTLLNRPVVIFRDGDGQVCVLEDRCCHRDLPLSCGTVEAGGLRCGYHGLLFNGAGRCVEIPGQARVPDKARVEAYPVREQDQMIWIWFGAEAAAQTPSQPSHEPPQYKIHSDSRYEFRGDVYHYAAPWQLIHDNLLDLSHLGYVHLKTIGGNARLHMNAETRVESDGDSVRVLRYMPDSVPPPTYTSAWPLKERVDRWQEIEFFPNHLRIWTGAVDAGTEAMTDPERGGFHLRGLHCITPETETTCHYLWTMAANRVTDRPSIIDEVYRQTAFTFEEDRVVIEAQYANKGRFPGRSMVDIHVDAGPNRARRIIERLIQDSGS